MATLRDIKNRIRGVQSTQQITKAMKMVAAAKLRRAQENIVNARPYARKIAEMLSDLVTEEDLNTNPFIHQREINNVAFVIVSADRGLCGAFNTNIIRETAAIIQNEYSTGASAAAHLFCVGKKGFEFFSKRDYDVTGKRIGFFSTLSYDNALDITKELIDAYLDGTFDKIIIVYNEFKSIIQQRIVKEQFLPVPIQKESEEELKKQPNYIFEPNQKAIFNYLLPKYLKAQMWRILLESNAAELGAKMTAMDNATTNAKELIRTLQIKYNKERQAAITKEILEIVSGANALKESNS
ncbi:MAG TPA: ATP synthase F1 subunit gamma [Ignavibacteriaceae bacterium]|nr:ATP synthase F1 subunit gamma [Ignavibacteriaceae bacterium]